jgi:hypothetical protein
MDQTHHQHFKWRKDLELTSCSRLPQVEIVKAYAPCGLAHGVSKQWTPSWMSEDVNTPRSD